MKQEEKELLLRDLCARLPYEVKVNIEGRLDAVLCDVNIENGSACIWVDGVDYDIEYVRPYLRPMSSMTEEELEELNCLCYHNISIQANNLCGYICGNEIDDVINYLGSG